MVQTTLSNHGYKLKKCELESSLIKKIKSDLTVNPFTCNDYGEKTEKRFSLYLESPNSLYLPRFYGSDHFGPPSSCKISEGDSIDIPFKGSMRDEQMPVINSYLDSAHKIGGGLISLQCGGGKTVISLYLLSLLKKKTIVIVHKDFLMTQWRDRILQFLPTARIGKVQQDTIDIENKDIVLAMVQSLSQKEYPANTFASFGLAIFDECHHLGAEIFSRSMSKVSSKYMLGLSATPNRKDGLRKVFEWFIGPMVYSAKTEHTDYIETRIYEYHSDDPQYSKEEKLYNGKQCFPRMINNVCEYEPRRLFISELVDREYQLGRKILILCDRREYLTWTLNYFNQKYSNKCAGLYVGGMKPTELRDSQEKDIILGTFSMASEGMDIPKLNTIVFASPKSDVVQSVGRILREKAKERQYHPLVIDIKEIHPNLSMFGKQCDKRIKYYQKCNHQITLYASDGTTEKIEKKKKQSKKLKEAYEINECLLDD